MTSSIDAKQNGNSWHYIVVVGKPGNTYSTHLPTGNLPKVFNINGAANVSELQGSTPAAGTAVTIFARLNG